MTTDSLFKQAKFPVLAELAELAKSPPPPLTEEQLANYAHLLVEARESSGDPIAMVPSRLWRDLLERVCAPPPAPSPPVYPEAVSRIVDRVVRLIDDEFNEPKGRPSTTPLPFTSGLAGAVNDVFAFHDAMDVPCLDEPDYPQEGRAQLRLDMACEELLVLAETMGCSESEIAPARAALDNLNVRLGWRANGSPLPKDEVLVGIADALIDKIYIDVGTLMEFGIPGTRVWAQVHAANMRKQGGPVRADGKRLKPEGWVGPDVHLAVFGRSKAER